MASVISIDGVLLPNKPLSNFEIENAVNKLGVPGFQGVFVRDSLPNKPKNRMWGSESRRLVWKWDPLGSLV